MNNGIKINISRWTSFPIAISTWTLCGWVLCMHEQIADAWCTGTVLSSVHLWYLQWLDSILPRWLQWEMRIKRICYYHLLIEIFFLNSVHSLSQLPRQWCQQLSTVVWTCERKTQVRRQSDVIRKFDSFNKHHWMRFVWRLDSFHKWIHNFNSREWSSAIILLRYCSPHLLAIILRPACRSQLHMARMGERKWIYLYYFSEWLCLQCTKDCKQKSRSCFVDKNYVICCKLYSFLLNIYYSRCFADNLVLDIIVYCHCVSQTGTK
jgi:hypothetical protein